jgi:hypothetical protein
MTSEATIQIFVGKMVPHPTTRRPNQHKDNIPPIEEATERKPYGLRIFENFKQHQSTF